MTRPRSHATGSVSAFSFSENGSAACYARICGLLPAKAASELPDFLAEAGNPDQAVLQIEKLLQQHPDQAIAALKTSALALRSCVALFGASPWLGHSLLQNPDLLQLFARPLGLVSARMLEDFREQFARFRLRSHEAPLPVLLAQFKRREYVRIFSRELLGLASLAEITAEISTLSDVLIERALVHCESELRRRYQGWPQLRSSRGRVRPARFSVLSLGKLGGNELNYSSDIDLLFLYDDAEDAGAISISTREFFTQLAQALTVVLSSVSVAGQVFRVDLRLRPQGASGEMVVGCAQALRYYGGVAQDWELQSLVKLRLSAGDRTLARDFVAGAQKLIYCKQLSLSAIQTAARSLEKIQRGILREGAGVVDVKNGAGGLREIEFVVQCLQRVHGGGEPWLRSSGTLFALQKLLDKGHIGDAEFRELGATYSLLRALEHRLQCRQGLQSHRLPESASEQAALFRSMGAGVIGSVQELARIMKSATNLCARVLRLGSGEGSGETTAVSVSLGAPGAEQLTRTLAARSSVLSTALSADVGDPGLRNLQRFLSAASTAKGRTLSALENAEWIERALPVFAQSALATDILVRHPEDIGALFHPGEEGAENGCERREGRSVSDQLRIDSRRSILRSVGRSLVEGLSVWEILGEYSRNFDSIMQQAVKAVNVPKGLGIFAVGRLGTCELDVVSDADIVFLRSAECDSEEAQQCALSLVGMLSGYTREGSVIAMDTRLRPHGNAGELVAPSRQLGQYFENDAKAWETLAFAKLRLIAGDESLVVDVSLALQRLRKRFAAAPEFVPELRAMRKRIADSGGKNSFKSGAGGLYDFDYLFGLLETRAALSCAGKQFPVRLEALLKHELLSTAQYRDLLHAANLFRRVDHAVRVAEGRSRTWLPESDALRAGVEHVIGIPDLDSVLHAEMRKVRAIFDWFFHD